MFRGQIVSLITKDGKTFIELTDSTGQVKLIPYNGSAASIGGGI